MLTMKILRLPMAFSMSAIQRFFHNAIQTIARGSWWAAVRIPSPIYVAMLSRTSSAVVATSSFLGFSVLLLIVPSGAVGLLGAMLSWMCAMVLAASAVRVSLLQRRVQALEVELRAKEQALNQHLRKEEIALLEKAQTSQRNPI